MGQPSGASGAANTKGAGVTAASPTASNLQSRPATSRLLPAGSAWSGWPLIAVCGGWLLAGCSGCATHAQRLVGPRQAFYTNDLEDAHAQLEKLASKRGDAQVVELDLALVDLLQGDPASAERRLRQVRDALDDLEQMSLAESAAAAVTDDQRRAYAGEDYEKLLLRVFLTLTSLMQDGVDAESYALQTLAKQEQLRIDAQERWGKQLDPAYGIPPIAPYLRGVIREASLNSYDDAVRGYAQASRLLPEATWLQQDLQRAAQGVHSQPGHGVVLVIALVGRGPYKIEVEERATQEALLIADRIVSAVGRYSVPPTLAPIKIPQIVSPPKPFDLIGVQVDGQAWSTTLPITDVHRLASETYAEKLPEVMARAVARRIIKKGAVYAAKDQLEVHSSLASLAMDAAGVVWEATEAADTRCWGLLPREIQVLRLELPVGHHRLTLEPLRGGRAVAAGAPCEVDVVDGGNTYILSYWPEAHPIGNILVSGRSPATGF